MEFLTKRWWWWLDSMITSMFLLLNDWTKTLDIHLATNFKSLVLLSVKLNHLQISHRINMALSFSLPHSAWNWRHQQYILTKSGIFLRKENIVFHLLNHSKKWEYVKKEAKIVYLVECLQKTSPPVVVFCERKTDVDEIHEYLRIEGVEAVPVG